jgi:hypothetical protein
MNPLFVKQIFQTAAISMALVVASSAGAQTVLGVSTFATGTAVNATLPDSIALGNNSVWVSYSNGADSRGLSGSSTVVQYKLNGRVRHIYSILGYVDGLKVDPRSGLVWAMQNQDGNSTLTLINPTAGTASKPISYAVTSSSRGYDDVVFRFNQVFVSNTNPTGPTDPTIQLVRNGSNPVVVTPILWMGATGTNLATGQANQPTAQNDPDSLKLTPNGDLMLSSGDDGQVIFVGQPGTTKQSVSFLTLLDPSTGLAVSGLDDVVFATADKGSFYLADTKNNQVLKIDAANLAIGSLYASVGSLNEFATVDINTGRITALVSNLSGPHGLEFLPNTEDGENDNTQE